MANITIENNIEYTQYRMIQDTNIFMNPSNNTADSVDRLVLMLNNEDNNVKNLSFDGASIMWEDGVAPTGLGDYSNAREVMKIEFWKDESNNTNTWLASFITYTPLTAPPSY